VGEELFEESQDIELALSSSRHACQPEHLIMATKQGHQASVNEVFGAGLDAPIISSSE
jgi:hypothetical protein